jgi:DDE superfamily endonuclease
MALWIPWCKMVRRLRPAFARETTFLWFALCLVGLTIRPDLRGVTSLIRALGLKEVFYDRLLDFFHSKAVLVDLLAALWSHLILTVLPASLVPKVNDRPVLIGDGIKVAKTGRKMPAVKKLHQPSTNNTKPEFIYGHSCQAIALLVGSAPSFFALPLTCRIHEGLVFSNRQTKSLLDKMIDLVHSLTIRMPFFLTLDAYYASQVIVHGLLNSGNHLVTQVRKNAVAYWPALPSSEKRRGPKRKYGEKVKLRTLFHDLSRFIEAPSPAYGECHVTIRYRPIDLLWRPVGILVRFVLVLHPHHGSKIFMTTDLSLSPLDLLRIYGFRFKIEIAFKQALYTLGTYAYHFWMATMTPRPNRSGDQYLHRKNQTYRDHISRKMRAYHCHMQLGIIAQGLLQYLSLTCTKAVWNSFGSWLRTIRDGIYPSEQVTALALRNTLPELLVNSPQDLILVNFIRQKIDLDRQEGLRLVAA